MTLLSSFPMRQPLAVVSAAALLMLAGCADMRGLDQQARAQMRTSQSLGLPAAQQPVSGVQAADAAALPAGVQDAWWRQLGDSRLDALVDQAVAGNPDIRMARARLEQAWAQTQIERADDLPRVDAQMNVTRKRYTENGQVPVPLAGSVRNDALLQLNVGWELDLFGKNRAALEAAIGSARAAQADEQAARLVLASQVVQGYVQLARLQAQLAVAERALAQRDETLRLVRDRYAAGLDTTLEVRQSEGGLPDARLQIEQLGEQIALARNALAALIGEPAKAASIEVGDLQALQGLELPRQLPASLLGRRADVVAARWRVEAARRGIDSAQAAFFPDINLTAFAGLSSLGLDHWLNGSSRQWGVGPAITLPVFEGGRLRANLRGEAAGYDLAVETYNRTVIGAVHDTADQLASIDAVARQQREQAQAGAAAQSLSLIHI